MRLGYHGRRGFPDASAECIAAGAMFVVPSLFFCSPILMDSANENGECSLGTRGDLGRANPGVLPGNNGILIVLG